MPRTRTISSGRSSAPATARSSRASTSRTPPTCSASAPRRRRRERGPRPATRRRLRGDRNHRVAVRRPPPMAPRVPDRRDQLPAQGQHDRDRARRPTCCRTPGTCPNEVRLCRARRAAQRRQVDPRRTRSPARKVATSPRGPAHDAPPNPRRGGSEGRTARPPHLPGWQKPIDMLTERMQSRVEDDVCRGPRRRRLFSTPASGSAPETVMSRGAVRPRPPGRDRH